MNEYVKWPLPPPYSINLHVYVTGEIVMVDNDGDASIVCRVPYEVSQTI